METHRAKAISQRQWKHRTKAVSHVKLTKAVETQGKGSGNTRQGQWEHKAKSSVLAVKAVEAQGKGNVCTVDQHR